MAFNGEMSLYVVAVSKIRRGLLLPPSYFLFLTVPAISDSMKNIK